MALKHKELPFQVKSLTFSQIKPFIEQHKQQNPEIRTNTVPLLLVYDAQDELKTVVHDSWNIASYLEDQYESSPALFPGSRSTMEPMTKFMSNYANQLVGVVAKCCVVDVYNALDESNKSYFKSSREERFGQSFDEIERAKEANIKVLNSNIAHIRYTLKHQKYIHGETVGYADYCLFGLFQWMRVVSPDVYEEVVTKNPDGLQRWMNELLNMHNGYAMNPI